MVVPAGAGTVDHDLWEVTDRIGVPVVPTGARETDGAGAGVVTGAPECAVGGVVPAGEAWGRDAASFAALVAPGGATTTAATISPRTMPEVTSTLVRTREDPVMTDGSFPYA